jgi:hypothetical protein
LAIYGWKDLTGIIGVGKIGEMRRACFKRERTTNEILRAHSVLRTARKLIAGGARVLAAFCQSWASSYGFCKTAFRVGSCDTGAFG